MLCEVHLKVRTFDILLVALEAALELVLVLEDLLIGLILFLFDGLIVVVLLLHVLLTLTHAWPFTTLKAYLVLIIVLNVLAQMRGTLPCRTSCDYGFIRVTHHINHCALCHVVTVAVRPSPTPIADWYLGDPLHRNNLFDSKNRDST